MGSAETVTKNAPGEAPAGSLSARDVKDLKRELRELKEELGATKGNLTKAYKTIEKLKAKPAVALAESVAPELLAGGKAVAAAEAPREHIVEWQPRFCPECGDKNAGFKDEVECTSCGVGLGSLDYAKNKMKVCPNCGNPHYKVLKK